ncbi:phosphodiester glycosidase family protein [Saccharopolyspora shandongensis]
MSVRELANLIRSFGATDAVNLDGGDSSTMAVLDPGQPRAVVKNVPSDGVPRAVANGIGIFSR